MEDNMLKYSDIERLSIEGVYALVNEVDKKVYIGYAVNILAKVSQICYDIERQRIGSKEMVLDKDKLDLTILQVCNKEESRLVMASQLEAFNKLGYTEYRKTPISKLKLKVLLEVVGASAWFVVVLRNTRGKDIVVGRFRDKEEMTSFVSKNYSSKIITSIVYHTSISKS
jgi:hypothetical protein